MNSFSSSWTFWIKLKQEEEKKHLRATFMCRFKTRQLKDCLNGLIWKVFRKKDWMCVGQHSGSIHCLLCPSVVWSGHPETTSLQSLESNNYLSMPTKMYPLMLRFLFQTLTVPLHSFLFHVYFMCASSIKLLHYVFVVCYRRNSTSPDLHICGLSVGGNPHDHGKNMRTPAGFKSSLLAVRWQC